MTLSSLTGHGSTSCWRGFKCALAAVSLITTVACAPTQSVSSSFDDGVHQAYNSSGVLDVPPYTRTIFSSTNF